MVDQPAAKSHIIKQFANFLVSGQWQPVLAALIIILFSYLISPVLLWVCMVIVALVTLVYGMQRGVLMVLWISLIIVGVSYLLGGVQMVYPFVVGLSVTYALALVLQKTASWNFLIQGLALLSIVLILLMYWWVPDIDQHWQDYVMHMVTQLEPSLEDEQSAQLMSGAVTMGNYITFGLFICLLWIALGRWLQAMVYNPGGLRKELHAIRLNWGALIVFLVVFIGQLLSISWVSSLLPVIFVTFTIAGLSVVHYLIRMTKPAWLWLMVFYAAFIGFYWLVPTLVILLAVLDIGFDVRGRIASKNNY